MNKLSIIRLASVAIPLVSALIALFLVMFQIRRLHQFMEDRDRTIAQKTVLEQQIVNMKTQPLQSKIAVVLPVPDEQSLFLNMVRGFALSSRVQLVKYENKPAPPPPPPPALGSKDTQTPAKPTGLPPGVIALTGNVEVAGEYQALRQFMYKLLRSPRLYNTTDLKWLREQQKSQQEKLPPTHLSFTLTRYVSAPAAVPPPVAPHSS